MKNTPSGSDVLFQQLGGRAKGEYEVGVRVGHGASTVRRPMEIPTLVARAWSRRASDQSRNGRTVSWPS
jgi:hypothetical protein